jgi:mono/diheme cytochrome c family protein
MRIRRILGISLLIVVAILAAAISLTIGWRPFLGAASRPLTDRKFEATAARLERGTYLVNNLLLCMNCHTEPDPSLPGIPPRADRLGAGQAFPPEEGFSIVAPNITPDPETGAGRWSDDALARAIREGIGHDGRPLFPMMPYTDFRHLSDEDLAAVIVYIRSLPPIRNELPATVVPFPINRLVLGEPEPLSGPVAEPTFADEAARGDYLATLAHCRECHTRRLPTGEFDHSLELAGGAQFTTLAGTKVFSLNITQDPTGIPYYDEEMFLSTIRNGQIGARKLDPLMPWVSYRNLQDDDLKAIFAFLKTVKPVRHAVNNSDPPMVCPICGETHGLGEKNKIP